jgi:hypothetical protein
LILLVPVFESIAAIALQVRDAAGTRRRPFLSSLISTIPDLSALAALLLLQAHVFQEAVAMDFDRLGLVLATAVFLGSLGSAALFRWLLPEHWDRSELYVLSRLILLISLFGGYAFVAANALPAQDASFSWRNTAIVCLMLGGTAWLGAILHLRMRRVLEMRSKLTTNIF